MRKCAKICTAKGAQCQMHVIHELLKCIFRAEGGRFKLTVLLQKQAIKTLERSGKNGASLGCEQGLLVLEGN